LKIKPINAIGADANSDSSMPRSQRVQITIEVQLADMVTTRKLTISSPDVPVEKIHSEISARVAKIAIENGATSISLGQLLSRLSDRKVR
jgi:hypothetical protein